MKLAHAPRTLDVAERSLEATGRGGFTLLELLVVLGLLALLFALSAGTFQLAHRRYSLQAVAGHIQATIRAARNTSLSTRTRSHVIIDPTERSVTAHSFEMIDEWSFESGPEGDSGRSATGRYALRGARPEKGRVGTGLSFREGGAHVECRSAPRYDLRSGVLIDAWVHHREAPPVLPPAREVRSTAPRKRLARTVPGRDEEKEPACTILEKEGAYFFGMTRSGALEGGIGSFRVRTEERAVPPLQWVFVTMTFDGDVLSLAADGIERLRVERPRPDRRDEETPEALYTSELPTEVPVTEGALYISSPVRSFPGRIDEVHLRGQIEPLEYQYVDLYHIVGWKKVIYFDRSGRLEPSRHTEPVRVVLVELPDDAAGSPTTVPGVDFSVTFDEWAARFREPSHRLFARNGPPEPERRLDQEEEEAKLEALYRTARRAAIEVDLLGVVR